MQKPLDTIPPEAPDANLAPARSRKTKRSKTSAQPKPPSRRGKHIRPIDPRIDLAIERMANAVVNGKKPLTITEAAQQARMSREGLSKALKRGDISARAQAKVRELLGTVGLVEAGGTMVKMLRSKSDYVALDAAAKVLAISGIKPPSDDRPPPSGGIQVTIVYKHMAQPQSGASVVQPIDVTPKIIDAKR